MNVCLKNSYALKYIDVPKHNRLRVLVVLRDDSKKRLQAVNDLADRVSVETEPGLFTFSGICELFD